MAVSLRTRRFTVADFHRMGEAGIFTEDDRVELLDGEIVEMTPIGSRHVASVLRLTERLTERARSRALVSVQNPIALGAHSAPQPDVTLLQPREDRYASALPDAQNVLLVIEVADESVSYDRQHKLPLYGNAGIPETWLVDLSQDRVEVHREPGPEGYRSVRVAGRGEPLTVERLPTLTITVDDILP